MIAAPELIQLLLLSNEAFPTTVRLEPCPAKKANNCNADNDNRDGISNENTIRCIWPTKSDTTIDNGEKDHDESKVAVHNTKHGAGLRLLVQTVVPESRSPLDNDSQQDHDSENLVRGTEWLGLGELGAEVKADYHTDESKAGWDGLVNPVPAYALGEDAEEDSSEWEEEDEGAAEAESVDDAGPVAVALDFFAFWGWALGGGVWCRKSTWSASGMNHIHVKDT